MNRLNQFLLFASSAFVVACSSNDSNDVNNQDSNSWVYQSLSVNVDNSDDFSRFPITKSLLAEETPSYPSIVEPTGLTATSIVFVPGTNLGAISYHSRSNTSYDGQVDLFSYTDGGVTTITASLKTAGRINHLTANSTTLFVGVDTKAGPFLTSINLTAEGFESVTSLKGVKLNGESVNSLAVSVENGKSYLYSATGGDGLHNLSGNEIIFDFGTNKQIGLADYISKPGFQKCEVEPNGSLKALFNVGNKGYRGKWVAVDAANESVLTMHMSKTDAADNTAFMTTSLYKGYVTDFAQDSKSVYSNLAEGIKDFVSKNVCVLNGNDLYICAGDKGLQYYTINGNDITLVATYDKHAYGVAVDGDLLYVACGTIGIRVLKLNGGSFECVKYHKYKVASGETNPSANYVALQGDDLYVAYGVRGIQMFNKNSDEFIPGAPIEK